MSITASSSFSSPKKINLQENIEYESPTLLEMEHFEKKNIYLVF